MQGFYDGISGALVGERKKLLPEDLLVMEANRLVVSGRLDHPHLLNHLSFYNASFNCLKEEDLDIRFVFAKDQIQSVCTKWRLRFLPLTQFQSEVPSEVTISIEELNVRFGRNWETLFVLSHAEGFADENFGGESLVFAPTIQGNFYLVCKWGNKTSYSRVIKCFPLRSIESLLFFLIFLTITTVLLIPNKYLSTDLKADYLSMYRVAAFFHLIILFTGLTIFYLFAFNLPFSSQIWDSPVAFGKKKTKE